MSTRHFRGDQIGTDRLRLPDFIIGGAPRSATSWLYELTDRHPLLVLAKPARPEPKFFLVDELFERGVRYYSSTWFADLPADAMLGEKSANYLESSVAAERMHAIVPHVKLIFMLRDPVDRAWSNYRWSRQNGFEAESFEDALALEETRERSLAKELRYSRPHAYFSRGLYADMLKPYFELFPHDRILILWMEECASNPAGTAIKVHRFLGVEPRPQDAAGLGTVNAAAEQCPLNAKVRDALRERYLEPNHRLAALLGVDAPICLRDSASPKALGTRS